MIKNTLIILALITILAGCSSTEKDHSKSNEETNQRVETKRKKIAKPTSLIKGPSKEFLAMSPEKQKKLQDYNMQLIRNGQPPFPGVPLTPEQDKQLVKEGILPPLEK